MAGLRPDWPKPGNAWASEQRMNLLFGALRRVESARQPTPGRPRDRRWSPPQGPGEVLPVHSFPHRPRAFLNLDRGLSAKIQRHLRCIFLKHGRGARLLAPLMLLLGIPVPPSRRPTPPGSRTATGANPAGIGHCFLPHFPKHSALGCLSAGGSIRLITATQKNRSNP